MERNNLWAPWRMSYIRGLAKKSSNFIEEYVNAPEDDDKNLVLWRTDHCIVMMNHFPYNNGHILIAPRRKVSDLSTASDAEMLEMLKLVRDVQTALSEAVHPNGFNVGVNFGRCAGAGVPDHMHIHIVPRWEGDTSFMHVLSDTDVISQSMQELFDLLKEISRDKNLPNV